MDCWWYDAGIFSFIDRIGTVAASFEGKPPDHGAKNDFAKASEIILFWQCFILSFGSRTECGRIYSRRAIWALSKWAAAGSRRAQWIRARVQCRIYAHSSLQNILHSRSHHQDSSSTTIHFSRPEANYSLQHWRWSTCNYPGTCRLIWATQPGRPPKVCTHGRLHRKLGRRMALSPVNRPISREDQLSLCFSKTRSVLAWAHGTTTKSAGT